MSTTIKILGAPPEDGESLCRTCRYAHIQRGFRGSEETVFCAYSEAVLRPVKFKVAACTDYTHRALPARWELEQMALLINLEPARKKTGFRQDSGAVAEEDEDSPSLAE
jgi:hypothetical protein